MAPMTPPDETLGWTDLQLEREIVRAIPAGTDLVCEWEGNTWSARLESATEGQTEVLQEALHVDRSMALYEIYGGLWLREQVPSSTASAWSSTASRPTVASVSEYLKSRLADPEDVDPVEVAAVYGLAPPKRREN